MQPSQDPVEAEMDREAQEAAPEQEVTAANLKVELMLLQELAL
jgi:hypothetical protein